MSLRLLPLAALSLCILHASGCGSSATLGPRAESNYRHPEYPYELRAAPESPTALLGPEWKADSLRVVSGSVALTAKQAEALEAQHYDWNEDGESDASEELPRYEARLVHDSGAVVFIRAVPVPPSLQGEDLDTLAHAYLEEVTRQGDVAARFAPEDLPTTKAARFEVAVLDEAACRISGIEAYRLEVVGRRTAPEDAPQRRARLIIVQPGYRHRVAGREDLEVPVMLVAAYTHSAVDFEKQEDDFNRFLGQWVLGGYGEALPTERLGHTCQP